MNRQAFTVVGLDWDFDDLTGGVTNQTAHTSQLTNLCTRTTGTGICHDADRVIRFQAAEQRSTDVFCRLFPLCQRQADSFFCGNITAAILLVDPHDLLFGIGDHNLLFRRNDHIRNRDRDGAERGIMVAHLLDCVKDFRADSQAVLFNAFCDEF